MLFEQQVYLNKETHQYFHLKNGLEYKPVSRIIDLVKNKFDKRVAKYCAGKGVYVGMDEAQVLEAWDAKSKRSSTHGTFLHDSLEYYEINKKCKEGSEHLLPVIKSVLAEYSDYKKIYQELILHNDKYTVAGTSDKPMLKAISKTSPIDISDYKTNEKIEFFNKRGTYLKYPLDYLQDCSYITYSLQLSLYAYFLECLTDRKIGRLFIHHIPIDDPLSHKIIPVAYMRDAAIKLLDYYIDIRDKKIVEVDEEDERINMITGEANF